MKAYIKGSRSCGVHDGSFHADEVTAIALLVQAGLIDLDKVVRTRDENRLAACDFVCDVGGVYDPSNRRFDHHQVDYEGRLSSAGMVLQYLKENNFFSKEYADSVVLLSTLLSLVWVFMILACCTYLAIRQTLSRLLGASF